MFFILTLEGKNPGKKRAVFILNNYCLFQTKNVWTLNSNLKNCELIKKELFKLRLKNIYVSCQQIKKNRSKVVWEYGKSKFAESEQLPFQKSIKEEDLKHYLFSEKFIKNESSVLAASLLNHDTGKAEKIFNELLLSRKIHKKEVRHEFISFLVLDIMLEKDFAGFEVFWNQIKSEIVKRFQQYANNTERFYDVYDPEEDFDWSIKDKREFMLFLVLTHHKMLSKKDLKGFIRDNCDEIRKVDIKSLFTSKTKLFFKDIYQKTKKILDGSSDTDRSTLYYKGLSMFSRASAILADHSVSSKKTLDIKSKYDLYANSIVTGKNKTQLNQPLEYHLEEVSKESVKIFKQMLSFPWQGLSQSSIDNILSAQHPDFKWQENCYNFIEKNELHKAQNLVFLTAETGSGKTLGAIKIIAGLNKSKPMRFTTGLGLKTLTMQTADDYLAKGGLDNEQMSCVIGDVVAQQVNNKLNANKNEDDVIESLISTISVGSDIKQKYRSKDCYPEFINSFKKNHKRVVEILEPPVLVSTIDFLQKGADLNKGVHFALALMRTLNSDLIIDEIDSYNSTQLVALCRLISLSVICGRNVVVASATLKKNYCNAVINAFNYGLKIRESMVEHNIKNNIMFFENNVFDQKDLSDINCLLKNDSQTDDPERINQLIDDHFKAKSQLMLNKSVTKRAIIGEINKPIISDYLQTIKKSVDTLHEQNNHLVEGRKGFKKISLGMVHIANRKEMRVIQNELVKSPDNYVSIYHSKMALLQRSALESSLNKVLSRKDGSLFYENDFVQEIIDNADTDDVKLILIVTPIEEVGRDHDFDWGVISPLSTSSVVQASGRINRHRKSILMFEQINIIILEYNYRFINTLSEREVSFRSFYHPGPEIEQFFETKEQYSAFSFFNIKKGEKFNLNRLVIEDETPLSIAEDKICNHLFNKGWKDYKKYWMSVEHYQLYKLRNSERHRLYFIYNGEIKENQNNNVFNIEDKIELNDCEPEIIQKNWINRSIDEFIDLINKDINKAGELKSKHKYFLSVPLTNIDIFIKNQYYCKYGGVFK